MTKIGSWRFWFIVVLAIALGACAARRERREQAALERAEQAQPAAPGAAAAAPAPTGVSAGEGQVVFMRSFGPRGAILGTRMYTASVFDVTEPGEPKFINHVQQGYKVIYPVKPGLYTFMVVSEAADFMQVTVLPGKTYYALVTPRFGVVLIRFSFRPIRANELDGKEFTDLEKKTRITRVTSTSLEWAKQNAPDIASKRNSYWADWTSKSAAERAEQTLNAEDGR